MTTLRDASKGNWNGNSTFESINAGSLQRIADAVEKMAERYTQLLDDNVRLRGLCNSRADKIAKQERRITAVKGAVTKMRARKDSNE